MYLTNNRINLLDRRWIYSQYISLINYLEYLKDLNILRR